MANKVNSLVLGWEPGSEEITAPITVNFTPKYIDTKTGGEVGSGIANGIELVPIASGEGLNNLRSNLPAMNDIAVLAGRIDVAKAALNKDDAGNDVLPDQRGLRGGDGSFFGGKKSKSKKHAKSKKHPKSKKRKSVRRR